VSRSQRQVLLGAVAVVAFAIAAYSFFGRGKGGPNLPKEFSEAGICLSCKTEGRVTYPHAEPAPHRCPKCGEAAFYPYYFCFECKKRFVPALVQIRAGEPLRLPVGIACTSCGSTSVSPFLPNQPDYEPSGDAPLPKWP
jgi:DNA-directed RNA polymerase subunit RPC12/RpoP